MVSSPTGSLTLGAGRFGTSRIVLLADVLHQFFVRPRPRFAIIRTGLPSSNTGS